MPRHWRAPYVYYSKDLVYLYTFTIQDKYAFLTVRARSHIINSDDVFRLVGQRGRAAAAHGIRADMAPPWGNTSHSYKAAPRIKPTVTMNFYELLWRVATSPPWPPVPVTVTPALEYRDSWRLCDSTRRSDFEREKRSTTLNSWRMILRFKATPERRVLKFPRSKRTRHDGHWPWRFQNQLEAHWIHSPANQG